MLFLLVCVFKPINVYDKPHLIGKFDKYLDLIGGQRIVSTKPVRNSYLCRNASGSHVQPSKIPEYAWEPMNVPLDFNYTRYEWRAVKATLELPDEFNAKEHFLRVQFAITRHWFGSCRDDDFPAGPEGRMWLNGVELAAIDDFHDGAVIKPSDITNGGAHEIRLFMGRCSGSHQLTQYRVCAYHKNTEALYQRLRFLIDIIKQLPTDTDQLPQWRAIEEVGLYLLAVA